MNKIIFLGTGSALNPFRQLTSICFVTDTINFLIDCGDGMGTVRQLKRARIKMESINDIFISHKHADHLLGLPFIIVNKIIKEKNKIRIFGPLQTVKVAKLICKTTDFLGSDTHRFAFIPIKPYEKIKLAKGITVSGFKMKDVPGRNITEYAFEVFVDKKRIVFSSDTNPNPKFTKFVNNADILIHECGGLDKNREKINLHGHSTARNAGECAEQAKVKQLILTHLPDETAALEVDLLNEAKQYFRGKVIIAVDLMEIQI
jgi:ribonuclease Z